MRLKRETEVAVAILVNCARSNGFRLRTADAANAASTTGDFAAHVVLKLVNAGFLRAIRGRNGGVELARPARSILLGDVLCRMESQTAASLEKPVPSENRALESDLVEIMAGAHHAMRIFLDRFSIADLAENAGRPGSNEAQDIGDCTTRRELGALKAK